MGEKGSSCRKNIIKHSKNVHFFVNYAKNERFFNKNCKKPCIYLFLVLKYFTLYNYNLTKEKSYEKIISYFISSSHNLLAHKL